MTVVDERRHHAKDSEVQAALLDLDGEPRRVSASAWPGSLSRLDAPGLYAWWVDQSGADILSEALRELLSPGRIYAGQAGATSWPSGRRSDATLMSRLGGNHIGGRARSSTFRFTLASLLLGPLQLTPTGPRSLAPDSESVLSRWIGQHLEVAVHPFAEADALADLEDRVLAALDPPLNLQGRPASTMRARLSELRSQMHHGREEEALSAPTKPTASRKARVSVASQKDRVTLHEELEAILGEQAGWMTTQQLADAVNERGRYSKQDGSEMTAFQVHGRTRNYDRLFERDGSRVRLRQAP